jgi:hypothetical protein
MKIINVVFQTFCRDGVGLPTVWLLLFTSFLRRSAHLYTQVNKMHWITASRRV